MGDVEKLEWTCPGLSHTMSTYVVICAAQCAIDRAYKMWAALDEDPNRPWQHQSVFQEKVRKVLETFGSLLYDWEVFYPAVDGEPDVLHLRIKGRMSAEEFRFSAHRDRPRTNVTMMQHGFDPTHAEDVNIFAPIFDDKLADKNVLRKVFMETSDGGIL